MKYLLDTHTVLWFFDDNAKLSRKAREIILDINSEKYVSIVSAWEIAIKISIEKLKFEGGVSGFLQMVDENGFLSLSVERSYVKGVQALPFFHRDPFDRLIVASAISEDMCLVTADDNVHLYNVNYIWN
jgi:PIN domain nuclease of toxin-antitoxin system